MPYLVSGWDDVCDILPAYVQCTPGLGSQSKIAMWPRQQTNRVDGRFRINSDSLSRPIATRFVCQLRYVHKPSPEFPRPEDFANDWFWFDLVVDDVKKFSADSGVAPNGSRVLYTWEYFDNLPFSGGAGMRNLMTMTVRGLAPVERWMEWPDNAAPYQYNESTSLGPKSGVISDPVVESQAYGGEWQIRDAFLTPLSECFPTDDLNTVGPT